MERRVNLWLHITFQWTDFQVKEHPQSPLKWLAVLHAVKDFMEKVHFSSYRQDPTIIKAYWLFSPEGTWTLMWTHDNNFRHLSLCVVACVSPVTSIRSNLAFLQITEIYHTGFIAPSRIKLSNPFFQAIPLESCSWAKDCHRIPARCPGCSWKSGCW